MRILVLGANGFIGAAIVTALADAGMTIQAVVRDAGKFTRRFPHIETITADLRTPSSHEPEYWHDALDGVDAVVNTAGVLQPRRARDAWAVHLHAPDALYAACERMGVERVIHVSAIGVEEADTVYARSKRAGEQALMARDLSWTVLRPAIVVGDGSYGGGSMLRAIAAFPLITPVIGDGGVEMDFIDRRDLARSIVALLRTGTAAAKILEPAAPGRMTFSGVVAAYRRWLGLRPRPIVGVPRWCAKVLARIGDVARLEPMTTTALTQYETRLTCDADGFEAATGVAARSLTSLLERRPADSQDLWHARLYLLRPLIRMVLVALWLTSGLLGIFANPERYLAALAPLTIDPTTASGFATVMGVIDLAIAGALFAGWRLKGLAIVQLALVAGYTLVLSILDPGLWGDPFGGLLKNIPILALIVVHRVLEEER